MPIDKATGEFSANVKGSHSLNCEVGALLLVREGGEGSASAAEIGSGWVIIRIDAPSAKVDKKAFGSYTLTIPTGSTGQWMGERPGRRVKVVCASAMSPPSNSAAGGKIFATPLQARERH